MTDPQPWARGGEEVNKMFLLKCFFFSWYLYAILGPHLNMRGWGKLFTEIPIKAHLVFVPLELKKTKGAFHS